MQSSPLPRPLAVPFEGHTLRADTLAGSAQPHLFCIHGGGVRCRSVFNDLRQTLNTQGIGSTALDCIGHGQTGGTFANSSLASRDRQALAVIRHSGAQPNALIGISMGAYNAVRLSEVLNVETLILVVPGIYTPQAYDVPFGPAFSAIIRKERSWVDSDAWEKLQQFEGRLLVIAAEHDEVIPLEIPERLVAAANRASDRHLLMVPGAGHSGVMERVQNTQQWLGTVTAYLGARDPVCN